MSVVIVGGNECMEHQYAAICKQYGCTAKIFTKEHGSFKKKLGRADLLILFTNTVSHQMIWGAAAQAKRSNIPIARVHTSSATALHNVLTEHCTANKGGPYAGTISH